jgi:ribonuclease BN (tRNA processing enzyme)
VDALVDVSSGADLFICECSAFENDARYHLNWRTIERNLTRLGARRLLLTHMGPEMLARCKEVSSPRVILGEDGMTLEV